MNYIEIDKNKCTHCGLCINDCVTKCLASGDDDIPKMIKPSSCISCQHCLSVCPASAISFNGIIPDECEDANKTKIKPEEILSLIKNRRSIRQFSDEEISEDTWTKLKEMFPIFRRDVTLIPFIFQLYVIKKS